MEKVRPWCGQPSDRGRLKNSAERATNGAPDFALKARSYHSESSFTVQQRQSLASYSAANPVLPSDESL